MTGARRAWRARLANTTVFGKSLKQQVLTPPGEPMAKSLAKRRGNGPLAEFESLLGRKHDRKVVLIAHESQRHALEPWLKEFAHDRVFVISADEAPEWDLEHRDAQHIRAVKPFQIVLQVNLLGAVDIIVNLLPVELLPGAVTDQYELFVRLFRFIKPKGAYILDRRLAPVSSAHLGLKRWTDLLAAAEDKQEIESLRKRDVELARSTGTIAISRDLIVATKRLKHYVKLRDDQVESLLHAREPELEWTELARLKGAKFASRATVHSYGSPDLEESLPARIDHPTLRLRHYKGRVALPGNMLMYTGHTILPDSFRWHMAENPTNHRLKSVSPNFARIDSQFVPTRRLEGNFYQLDSHHAGHFGHLTTEVVSRLWGWDRAKQEIPDLKLLYHLKPKNTRHPALELALFTAYGIGEEDIVWVDGPVWVDSVVSATPMWHNEVPHYAHPDIQAVWDRLTDGLLRDAPVTPARDRIFVSRGRHLKNRFCRNAAHVEKFFVAHGFDVIYPEKLALPEQVAIFSQASTVAGFGGSAMFNLMHARQLKTTIVLSHDAYTARNEHLFTSIRGGDAHYFWSPSDLPQPGDAWSKEAFFSDWEFDFESHRADLEKVLRSL